jgi:hypothetical protein
MPLPKDKAWFCSKTYGWGWGLPIKWQGWVTLLLYLGAMTIGAIWLPTKHLWLFILFCVVVSGMFIAICYWKGESPRWRWGKDD